MSTRRKEMDFYSKVVFTVIAIALSIIAGQRILGSGTTQAQAQTPTIAHVAICDTDNPKRCVGISDKGWLDVQTHSGS
jgi:hypothetical protein